MNQTLIDAEYIKKGGFDSELLSVSESERYIDEASLRLQDWVGRDLYLKALTSTDESLTIRLKQAEYYLFVHIIVLSVVFMQQTLEPKKLKLGDDLEIELFQLTSQDKESIIQNMLFKAENLVKKYIDIDSERRYIYVS